MVDLFLYIPQDVESSNSYELPIEGFYLSAALGSWIAGRDVLHYPYVLLLGMPLFP
jgi:hypothetical protein